MVIAQGEVSKVFSLEIYGRPRSFCTVEPVDCRCQILVWAAAAELARREARVARDALGSSLRVPRRNCRRRRRKWGGNEGP